MGNYLNKIENNKDYLDTNKPMFRELICIPAIPTESYKHVSSPLKTHMRMMYGHVDWNGFVVELDDLSISMIEKTDCWLKPDAILKPGMKVVVVDSESMGPVTFCDIANNNCALEVLTLDDAIEQAAFWYFENLNGDFAEFHLATIYFLLAFRLAVMEGNMDDEARFLSSRLNKVWRETYASMLFQVSKKMEKAAIDMVKGSSWNKFDLEDYEVEEYQDSLNGDED